MAVNQTKIGYKNESDVFLSCTVVNQFFYGSSYFSQDGLSVRLVILCVVPVYFLGVRRTKETTAIVIKKSALLNLIIKIYGNIDRVTWKFSFCMVS